jgi:molybdopterin synthase catalytic subunit
MATIRIAQPADREEWTRMRQALWPDCTGALCQAEIDASLAGAWPAGVPSVALVADAGGGRLCGFVEISIKPLDGFATSPVGYIEGWYVDEPHRRKGLGRRLIDAAGEWARSHGCTEVGSGCDVWNHTSREAHLAIGFRLMDDVLFFRKSLAFDAPASPVPVSPDWIELRPAPLLVGQAVAFVTDATAGGVDVFLGTTRAETSTDGRTLVALDYEAYAEMALRQLRDMAGRAREQWPIVKLALVHRIGRVPVGEPSVIIAVSTPHRADSFVACRWLIDQLKVDVAIWKKEIWADGSGTWVHPQQ